MSTTHTAPELLRADDQIHGTESAGFEPVKEAFAENFSRRKELGAACCVYQHGEKVVDLWGGVRSKATGEPWEADTMVLVFSATKGFAAMVMALAQSRGLLEHDERVRTYWPEFAQQGKENVTVRQLLAHQAGLFAFDERVDKAVVADLDRLAAVIARQRPQWPPGERQAYHAISLGFYEGELLRRVDPQHRTLGQFFQDEIASPLGADVYVRLPEEIPNSRLAPVQLASPMGMLVGMPWRLSLSSLNPPVAHLPGPRQAQPRIVGAARRRADLRTQPGGPVGRRRRQRPGDRPRVQRLRNGRPRDRLAPRDCAGADGPAGPRRPRIPRRSPDVRGSVLARLLKAVAPIPVRAARSVRVAGIGRFLRVRRPRARDRVRLRHQSDGSQPSGGPTERRVAGGSVFGRPIGLPKRREEGGHHGPSRDEV